MVKKSEDADYVDSYPIRWKDIELAAKIAPEHYSKALEWISFRLGYIPPQVIYMPYLATIQAMSDELERTHKFNNKSIEEEILIAQHLRNEDMKKSGWIKNQFHEEKYHTAYEKILPMYKHRARELLCADIGYEPFVEHSFEAEIFLRHMFAMDDYHEGIKFSWIEMKAMTIAHYRRIYETYGEELADESVLVGALYNDWKKRSGIPLDF